MASPDGLPALALAVDPPEPDLLQRQPCKVRSGIFSRPVTVLMIAGGLWSTLVVDGAARLVWVVELS